MQQPAGTPPLSARATAAAIVIVLLPFAAMAFNTVVLARARDEAGPPDASIVMPFPDGVVVVDESADCGPGNWVRCWRVFEVEADEVTGESLASDLGRHYRDEGLDLYQWRRGWRNTDCSRETGICVAIDPVGRRRARVEISRMSDGL